MMVMVVLMMKTHHPIQSSNPQPNQHTHTHKHDRRPTKDELLSLCVVKHGRKLVAGTQSGVLLLFSWGQWANCSDRFVGHPETVEAIVAVDEVGVCGCWKGWGGFSLWVCVLLMNGGMEEGGGMNE
jgi:hypothetical protein